MTADSNLVCRRCGYTNVPGDTFCGSCGAFLEWEGERSADAGAAGPTVVTGPAGPPGPVVTTGQAPTTPVTTGGVPVGAAPPGGDLVRCPACGVANAASRTFCQACGSKLAEAGRVGSVTEDQIIAAVNAPNKPVTVTTTTIRRAGGDPDEGSGGVLKWIAVMAVLGVIVGVAVVLGSSVIRGEGPASSASAAPSSTAAAGGSDGPTPSITSTSAPTGEPTDPPPNEPLVLQAASAKTTVAHGDKFAPAKAIDGDPTTCWQEGADKEAGQWIEVAFSPSKVSAVVLTNGYNASKALFKGNHRLKDIEISINGGAPIPFTLKDHGEPQKIDVKNVSGASSVRITILTVYKSVETKVHNTPFDDAALAEIRVMGVPGS